jgi:hypothetical protein
VDTASRRDAGEFIRVASNNGLASVVEEFCYGAIAAHAPRAPGVIQVLTNELVEIIHELDLIATKMIEV